MYRSIESQCCVTGSKIVFWVNHSLRTNKQIETDIKSDLWLPEAGGAGGGIGCRHSKGTNSQLYDKYRDIIYKMNDIIIIALCYI